MAKPKQNIRTGDGAGATMGFRGGKGKPGYPVPDVLKNKIEPIDEIIDDVLHSLIVPLDIQKQNEPTGVVKSRDDFDIIVKKIIDGVVSEVKKKKKKEEKGDDLGFGFNEDGYPIQDKYEFQDMPIAVENKKGSTRKWYDKDGKEGSTKMRHDYGYVEGVTGSDGEPVDVYVGPSDKAEFVYVVHQNKAPDFEKYDEDKVMLGFDSEESARKAYLKQYNDERFYGGMSSMPIDVFRKKLKNGGKITNEARRWKEFDAFSKAKAYIPTIQVPAGMTGGDELVLFDPSKFLSPTGEDRSVKSTKLGEKIDTKKESLIPVLEAPSSQGSGINLPQSVGDRGKDANTVFDLFKDKIEERGTKLLQKRVIGHGSRAIVFDIGGNKVLKITNDFSDAEALAKFKGKNVKHIVHVFDVFEFGGWDLFGIVTEKLQEIPGTSDSIEGSTGEAHQLDHALMVVDFNGFLMDNKRAKWSDLENFIESDRSKHALEVLKKFNIDKMLDELNANGIDVQDFWSGNIMKRGSDYVMSDLGYSDVDNPLEIDYLKEIVDSVVEGIGTQSKEGSVEPKPEGDLFARTLQANAARLKNAKIDVSKALRLGGGANGVAYDLRDGTVLKITLDKSEAKTSNFIKGKKLEHVADIYDAFRFKIEDDKDKRQLYGIHQEKLENLTPEEKASVMGSVDILHERFPFWQDETSDKIISFFIDLIPVIDGENEKRRVQKMLYSKEFKEMMAIMDELDENGIKWYDMHSGNVKKKNGHLAAIDLGISDSAGQEPAVLEKIIYDTLRGLREGRADQVGVTMGTYQPFHGGHSKAIRDMCKKLDRLLVIVVGEGPLSFEDRSKMIKVSLPDVISKIEIHKGKGDDIVDVLSKISIDKRSSLVGDTAFTVFVGSDRLSSVKDQMKNAVGDENLYFDPSMVDVLAISGAKSDDDVAGVSGAKMKEALSKDDKKSVEKMLDPHLVSNKTDLEDVYVMLKKMSDGVNEAASVFSGRAAKVDERDIEDVLDTNSEQLSKKGIDTNALKKLGAGTDGVAYSIGGGRVLKVTTNEEEAGASMKIKNTGGSHNTVKVYDVFRFRPQTVPGGRPLFGIVTELLKKLDRNESEEFDEISAFWLDPDVKSSVIPFLRNGDYQGLLTAIKNVLLKHELEGQPINVSEAAGETVAGKVSAMKKTPFSSQSSTEPTKVEKQPTQPVDQAQAKASVDAKIKKLDAKYKKYKLPDMLKDLRTIGIKFSDFHSGNVMKRGNDYVINDLGRSEGGLAGNSIPILERKIEDIVSEFFAFTGIGNSMTGTKAGSSSVSSFKNRVDPNSKELWQNQLDRLQIKGSGSLP